MVKKTELSLLPEDDISSKVYVKVVDLTLDETLKARDLGKKVLPQPSNPADLCNFYVTPSRHQAYSSFWLYGSFLVAAGNVVVWFYF